MPESLEEEGEASLEDAKPCGTSRRQQRECGCECMHRAWPGLTFLRRQEEPDVFPASLPVRKRQWALLDMLSCWLLELLKRNSLLVTAWSATLCGCS